MKSKIIIKCFLNCLFICTLISCKKMDSTYERFIKDGPIVYPARIDSVFAFAGNKRVQLKWVVPKDRTVTSYKVFWNFGADSVFVPVNTKVSDSVKVLIDNLTEGTYNFTVFSYDKDKHRSVGASIIENAYGSIFSAAIDNRAIRTLKKDAATSSVDVIWVGLDQNCIGTEWNYTRKDGLPGNFFSPIGDTTVIADCDISRPVSYRSLFLPESNAIDIFYTQFKLL